MTCAIGIVLLPVLLVCVNCFKPTRNACFLSPVPSFDGLGLKATVQDSRMTFEDESILFGDVETSNAPFPGRHRRKSRTGNLLADTNAPLNPLDYSSSDPLINKLRTVRETLTSCPQLWPELTKHCGDMRALLDDHLCDERVDLTFSEMNEMVHRSAAVFASLGVTKGVNIAVLGENSARWLIADHGIQLAGGVSAVRGADAPVDELRYIYRHSDSAGVAVLQGPRLLVRIANDAQAKGMTGIGLENETFGQVETVVLMHREKKTDEEITKMAMSYGVKIYVFADLLEATDPIPVERIPNIGVNDLSTIVYTSGTTGRPKGVMLTHGNLIHQLGHRLAPSKPFEVSEPLPGNTMLSLLPVWHITERTFELWMASRGCNVVYSSIRSFKNDLARHKPQWLVLVPRVLEKVAMGVQDKFSSGSGAAKFLVKLFTATGSLGRAHAKIAGGLVVGRHQPRFFRRLLSRVIVVALSPINAAGDRLVWQKVKAGFGGKLKVIISGGSALAGSLESFYETAGIDVCVGYGLTECSPLIAYRRSDENLVFAGCVGKAALDTELRVVNPDEKALASGRKPLPNGEAGVVIARGPQIMQGYYKNAEATAEAIDQFGWFDTGDLGRINPATGDLILTGRCKDTIVLSNGENIEPGPIEDAILCESPLIEQVMLMGQDGRRLIAVAVLSINELARIGFLTKEDGEMLQAVREQVNDPKCTEDDCIEACNNLNHACSSLRSNGELAKALSQDVKRATSGFRKWEQVGDVYMTLEPFAMANGQLTQSYKIKRDSVMKCYANLVQ